MARCAFRYKKWMYCSYSLPDLSVVSQGLVTLHQGPCVCDVDLKTFYPTHQTATITHTPDKPRERDTITTCEVIEGVEPSMLDKSRVKAAGMFDEKRSVCERYRMENSC